MTFQVKNKIGKLGEDIACRFLMKQAFSIVERNYWKKWGEIDIIAEKHGNKHFVEVKSVARENIDNVAHETGFRPEENVHERKIQRLSRVIQTYIAEKGIEIGKWQFDIITVYIEEKSKRAKVIRHENVIL